MSSRVFVLCVVACAVAGAAGCKKRAPDYDQSTPEKSLEAFFTALDKGRIPADLERLVGDAKELATWEFRCKQNGCESGNYTIVSRDDPGTGFEAVLYVTYEVTGEHGDRVMRGTRSPIRFELRGQQWMITQFGRRIPAGGAGDDAPSPEDDAAPDEGAGDASQRDDDAGSASDAAPPEP